MNTDSKILIHAMNEGYTVTDYSTGKKYAKETAEGVISVIKKALGIPEPSDGWLINLKPVEQSEEVGEKKKETVDPHILKKDILIPKFEYDLSLKKEIPEYKNTWYVELPDGKVVIGYQKTNYYTTKNNILQIPYPVPYNYLKGSGLSTVARTCIRAYRSFLAERPEVEASTHPDSQADKKHKQTPYHHIPYINANKVLELEEIRIKRKAQTKE